MDNSKSWVSDVIIFGFIGVVVLYVNFDSLVGLVLGCLSWIRSLVGWVVYEDAFWIGMFVPAVVMIVGASFVSAANSFTRDIVNPLYPRINKLELENTRLVNRLEELRNSNDALEKFKSELERRILSN